MLQGNFNFQWYRFFSSLQGNSFCWLLYDLSFCWLLGYYLRGYFERKDNGIFERKIIIMYDVIGEVGLYLEILFRLVLVL